MDSELLTIRDGATASNEICSVVSPIFRDGQFVFKRRATLKNLVGGSRLSTPILSYFALVFVQ